MLPIITTSHIIVGFGHRVYVGKNTAAEILINKYGFKQYAFADEMKQEVCERFRDTLKEIIRVYMTTGQLVNHEGLLKYYADAVAPDGQSEEWWDHIIHQIVWEVKPPIVRRLIQNYATEVWRKEEPERWIRKLAERIIREGTYKAAITDLRFFNEGNWIHSLGGLCLKITKSTAPIVQHESESQLDHWDKWDAVIPNEGTKEQLWDHVETMIDAKWLLATKKERVQ